MTPASEFEVDGVGGDGLRRVSRASQIPLYHQVANSLREPIVSGIWGPGRRLPSEMDLVARYGASRITIRQALAELTHEGLILRERGRGSFVRDPTITAGPHELTSFSAEMRARGLRASSRVLSIGIVPADADTARRLDIVVGEPVVRIERLRLGDDEPIGLQLAYLPAREFPGLEMADFGTASLYEQLEARYGAVIEEADETFIVASVDPEAAAHLELTAGSPGLIVERIGWSGGRPVEFTKSVMRGDRYRVQLRLRRRGVPHRQPRIAGSRRSDVTLDRPSDQRSKRQSPNVV
jgi:GntR family transcriptional regulator, N-acetylglucosamine utilization regulator